MRDLNKDLRKNVSKVELKCILAILELTVDKGEMPLATKVHFKDFARTQVHHMTRVLIVCGLIVTRRSGTGTYIECVDSENAKNILENKPAPSSACVMEDFHNVISVTQCEALEVLTSALKDKTTIINICELAADNHFEPATILLLLKYLNLSGIIEVEKCAGKKHKITIIDNAAFKLVVERATKRIDELWKSN